MIRLSRALDPVPKYRPSGLVVLNLQAAALPAGFSLSQLCEPQKAAEGLVELFREIYGDTTQGGAT